MQNGWNAGRGWTIVYFVLIELFVYRLLQELFDRTLQCHCFSPSQFPPSLVVVSSSWAWTRVGDHGSWRRYLVSVTPSHVQPNRRVVRSHGYEQFHIFMFKSWWQDGCLLIFQIPLMVSAMSSSQPDSNRLGKPHTCVYIVTIASRWGDNSLRDDDQWLI